MTTTGFACPRCKKPLDQGANFCANCGADISGVWGPNGEALGKTTLQADWEAGRRLGLEGATAEALASGPG